MADRSESLDYASRWLRDSMQAWRFIPTFFEALDVDMTRARQVMKAHRDAGLRVTYAHLIVHATAAVLAAQPDFHVMVCGNRRYRPDRVDIALSVANDYIAAPTMVIEGADRKTLREIAEEIPRRIPEVQAAAKRDLEFLRRWGRLVPFAFLRRAVVRASMASFAARHRLLGTFQVSISPEVDIAATTMFGTSAMLVAGRVRDLPAVVDGQVAVRPIITFSCCADHRVFDGKSAGRFLNALKSALESAEAPPIERAAACDRSLTNHT